MVILFFCFVFKKTKACSTLRGSLVKRRRRYLCYCSLLFGEELVEFAAKGKEALCRKRMKAWPTDSEATSSLAGVTLSERGRKKNRL
ncbi:hypothetical protein CHARACLAT_013993 [Characodon lateralis]|uniref:Secreted protein n=1 Tax=Characodon lateralis TaxID=208331 RepID=A0ABU7D0U8_9TELE|nr:hypothetical protein [Characodon lateralis]